MKEPYYVYSTVVTPANPKADDGGQETFVAMPGQPAKPQVQRRLQTLVKRTPLPNEQLEQRYGVKAADLVRYVRASEQWIHQIHTLQLRMHDRWTQTPQGLAYNKAQMEAGRYWPPTISSTGQILPVVEGTTAWYVDMDSRRFREESHLNNGQTNIKAWNAQVLGTYTDFPLDELAQYHFSTELGEHEDVFQASLSWLRTQQHPFWWQANVERPDEATIYGRPEDFVLVGREDYHGTPCYVLECRPSHGFIRRWYVAVQDGLLRSYLVYN